MNWSYVVETNAGKFPDKEAIVYGERRIPYRALNDRVNGLAKGLLDLGTQKGDIVAILLYNCPEYIEITFAANKIGAVWLPLNFRLTGPELAYILNNAEATAEALKNGWFHTGDIGRLDEEGYLYIEDRKKDIIISGGENISSQEVERVIYESPKVLEAAVVGIPHPKWLEVPKAYVVLKKGERMTPGEVMEICSQKLAKFKVPKEVEFIDALPRNPSGKILKRALRERNKGK